MTNFASLASLCVMGAGMALAPQAALGQDLETREKTEEAAPRSSGIDAATAIIVVTANKGQNPEDVQDIPLSVTAFNAGSLDALKVRSVQDLTFSAPNVSLDQVGTSRGQANFSIRGLGVNSSIPSIDPTVGVFVDGVYLGFNAGVVFDVFDLDSVELLRGPQGILFGRNTTGGAVLLNTGNPTEEFSGKFRTSVDGPFLDGGRGGANYTASGVISGPIIEDVLLFKIGAYYNKDEGYFTNLFDGQNHGAAETKILRGALEVRPSDALTIIGKLDYFKSDGDGPSAQNHGIFQRDTYDFSIDEPGFYANEIWTGSIRADLDIGPGTLTNIFGYRTYKGDTLGDIDSSPTFFFHSWTGTEQKQISNELRYAFSIDDTLNLTLGGFYFNQNIDYSETRNLPTVTALTFYGGGQQEHEVLGAFAQGQFHVTDALSVIGGIRWSKETKDAGITYIRPRPACSVIDGTCPTSGVNPYIPTENNGFTDTKSWESWSPKLGLQYEFSTGQVYTSWTRGYRSGGYNFRTTNATVFETVVVPATGGNFYFGAEKVDSYEVGAKFQTDDGVFTLNAAAYMTKIDDMQREVNQSSPTAGVSQFILNTADATIIGFEAETKLRVNDDLLLTANLGLIDDKYDSVRFDISGDGVIDDADLALRQPRVPQITWGLGVLHQLDLGSSAIISRVNFQYRDKFAYTDNNFGWIPHAEVLDANVTWETPVEGLSFSVYGKNLLDNVQFGGDTQVPFGGALSSGINAPFTQYPAGGTLSPLSKGRQIGVEALFGF